MLKRRLIPKLQMQAQQIGSLNSMVLVTTKQFDNPIPIGDPVSQAKIYQSQAADELVFLDIRPDKSQREMVLKVLKRTAEEVFMPFCVGGGVTSLEDFRLLLQNGADKVSVNSEAVRNPDLINKASEKYGAQCVVVSIDYKLRADGKKTVRIEGGSKDTGLDPVEWAKEAQARGAGEIMLTSIDHDGMQKGMDIEMAQKVREVLTIPLIIGGGCGLASHFVAGFQEADADAVTAGTYFSFRDQNPMQARGHIANAGVPIRLHMG